MKLYFDTSALVKYFHNESGSKEVIKLIDDRNNSIWISELAVTEFTSALHRKFRMEEIGSKTLQEVLIAFESKIAQWNLEPFSALQTEEANKLIIKFGKTTGLRTLDALQLAAFNLLRQNDWEFVVSDSILNKAAI